MLNTMIKLAGFVSLATEKIALAASDCKKKSPALRFGVLFVNIVVANLRLPPL